MFSCLVLWASCDTFALRSDLQGEGHAAQVAVSGRIVNDALSVQFALYLDVSALLHARKTYSHDWWRVVYLREERQKIKTRRVF